jgi:superfamily II DNA or RNA helicase
VPAVLDSRLRVPLAGLPEDVAAELRAEFTHDNPNYGRARHEGEPPTFRTWAHDPDGNLALPLGGLARATRILSRTEPGFRPVDGRTYENPEEYPAHRKTPRDYQEEQIRAALADDTGILRAPTGSGKSTTSLMLLARLKRRAIVCVSSAALMKQWRDRAVEELGLRPDEIGHVQASKTEIRPLTLAMLQTLESRFSDGDLELADQFDVVIADEIQHAAAPSIFAAIDPLRARRRYGVSASEKRKDRLEFLTYDLFGPVISEVEETRLLASGAVVDVEVNVVHTKFRAPWYRYRQDFNLLLKKMTEDPERNALILRLVRSAVVAGEQVIVFTHRIEHARYLDGQIASMGIPGGLMLGGAEEAREFDRTKSRLAEGKLRAAVGTYNAIGEGIDVPAVARGIAATPISNNAPKVNQVKGRICRPSEGKTVGKLAVLVDAHVYGRRPVENLVDWCRTVRVWDEGGKRWVDARAWLSASRR